jgi:hypothetical protein
MNQKHTPQTPETVCPVLFLKRTSDVEKLNKTESLFWQYLQNQICAWVGCQCITLKLADDTRYTPDFWSIENGKLFAYEVKGFWRDDAKVKVKVAARTFPWISFRVVQKQKDHWKFTEIKP